jgi:hypothetical protein
MGTTEELKARLEAFRIEYRKSQEAGQRLAAELAPAGDAAGWLRSRAPAIRAAARREQAALARELETDFPRRQRPERAAGSSAGGGAMTPDNFAFRTMGR